MHYAPFKRGPIDCRNDTLYLQKFMCGIDRQHIRNVRRRGYNGQALRGPPQTQSQLISNFGKREMPSPIDVDACYAMKRKYTPLQNARFFADILEPL
jgi:hypothetical protein